jgi:hypothetical protein
MGNKVHDSVKVKQNCDRLRARTTTLLEQKVVPVKVDAFLPTCRFAPRRESPASEDETKGIALYHCRMLGLSYILPYFHKSGSIDGYRPQTALNSGRSIKVTILAKSQY